MTKHSTVPKPPELNIAASERLRLQLAAHATPHDVLGAHPVSGGCVVRAFHPDAEAVDCLIGGEALPMTALGEGVFAVFVAPAHLPLDYRLRFRFADGSHWERDDPYRFLPTIGEVDCYLFNEGTHRHLWRCLGAHLREMNGVKGVAFAVWAPSARRVSVVGDFCRWDGRLLPMRAIGSSGVFEIFVPGLEAGVLYKFEILTGSGSLRLKADPFAFATERPPGTASRVVDRGTYTWQDDAWMSARLQRDWPREPMRIYEVHLGSWRRVPEERNRALSYRELAETLVPWVKELGFTHLELLPVAEHPFEGSWGYQVTGYFAPTSRFGTPDDFRFFVDACHRAGIGVLVDWVPAHFPKDDFALRRFDGTALYEHEDPRQGEHPDWGTLIFNYGRAEVRNFLIANALFWLDEFHIDGLRVDAVASMLYLDYSRQEGEWIPNVYGGRENLDAVEFVKSFNEAIRTDFPGCFTVAEESTAWSGVTAPVADGGLGFTFKWNMGWMHDTLEYFSHDPVHRRYHQDELTFAMLYENSEHFIMPLSHDEVVHGKGALLAKMPGDEWQKLANLRTLLGYQTTRPGKSLLFMGTELAPYREWDHDTSLDWHLLGEPNRAGLRAFLVDLGRFYAATPCFWAADPDPSGFAWIDCNDRENSVLIFERRHGDAHVVVVLNLTPVPREDYRVGAPLAGTYVERLNSDATAYGGSGYVTAPRIESEPVPFHGRSQSLRLRLPPLSILVLGPEDSRG
jgi:1,4-alpha-glucan branching enzyme